MAEASIYLTVLSDDFGMCPAVNEGTIQAFTEGLLTDANIMAPCPSFDEAVKLAKTHPIPLGIHNTFTAEWDYLRYKPLTPLKSMTEADGTFRRTVSDAWNGADPKEAEAEFEAQWAKVEGAGIKITHACEHMGVEPLFVDLYTKILKKKRVPYRNSSLKAEQLGIIPHVKWDSVFASSAEGTELAHRKGKLKQWLDSLKPGYHLWATHSAIDHPSLDKITAPTHKDFKWARLYRALDQALLMDTEVKDWIAKKGIQLTPVSKCPVVGL